MHRNPPSRSRSRNWVGGYMSGEKFRELPGNALEKNCSSGFGRQNSSDLAIAFPEATCFQQTHTLEKICSSDCFRQNSSDPAIAFARSQRFQVAACLKVSWTCAVLLRSLARRRHMAVRICMRERAFEKFSHQKRDFSKINMHRKPLSRSRSRNWVGGYMRGKK